MSEQENTNKKDLQNSEVSVTPTLSFRERKHVVENLDIEIVAPDTVEKSGSPAGFWKLAWIKLRVNPVFFISLALILVVLSMAIVPSLWTGVDPFSCELSHARQGATDGHIFGYDVQGCDVYARVIYGARASVFVGLLTALAVLVIGGVLGCIAGFFSGWIDTIVARFIDIFFAIPMLLGAIVVLQMFKGNETIFKVVLVIAMFSWTSIARITRGAVLEAKNKEFIVAAKALGATKSRILLQHVIPNAIAPVISTVMVSLGTYIVAEATLSFLGIGLPSTMVSWGGDISTAQSALTTTPMVLFWPSLMLAITVLSFIMLGDVVYDALNPKARKR